MNNILVLGNGAREHSIICKLLQSTQISNIFVHPNNDGILQQDRVNYANLKNYKNDLIDF